MGLCRPAFALACLSLAASGQALARPMSSLRQSIPGNSASRPMAGSPASTAMSRRACTPPMSMRASSRSPSTPTLFAALMGYFEARKGRWRVFTDAVLADLGFPGHLNYDINISASGNPFARLPDFKGTIKGKLKINANAQLDYQETIIQSGVAFCEVANGVTRAPTRPWTSWAALAIGARTSTSRSKLQGTLTADVQADFRRVGLDLKRKVKGSKAIAVAHAGDLEWVDPVVGGRMRHQFASGSEFNLEGDVGGFGSGERILLAGGRNLRLRRERLQHHDAQRRRLLRAVGGL